VDLLIGGMSNRIPVSNANPQGECRRKGLRSQGLRFRGGVFRGKKKEIS
jgi:hypothetical protein